MWVPSFGLLQSRRFKPHGASVVSRSPQTGHPNYGILLAECRRLPARRASDINGLTTAYANKAARAAAPEGQAEQAGRHECAWQREQLPEVFRELVLDDHRADAPRYTAPVAGQDARPLLGPE